MDALAKAAEALQDLFKRSWSLDTAATWRPDNPALGQCGVTALVVQDVLGGEILKTKAGEDWHFYNRIDSRRLDLTASQFPTPIRYDDIVSDRTEALTGATEQQYRTLRSRVIG